MIPGMYDPDPPGRFPHLRLISRPISWGVVLAVVAGFVLVAGAAVALAIVLSTQSHTKHKPRPVPVPIAFKVCKRGTVLTMAQRLGKGLTNWPDGTIGIVVSGGHDHFVGPDTGQQVAQTTGTSSDPAAHGLVAQSHLTTHLQSNYASGGPIYRVSSRRWLLFYHAERWPHDESDRFYSWLGMAVSNDQGHTWHDLGQIIRPHIAYNPNARQAVEVGGGPYVIIGGYFYVYFRDEVSANGIFGPTLSDLSVARAPVASVVSAAARGRVVKWHDYDAGGWTQPGIGGKASPLETGNPPTGWFSVGYDPTVKRYILIAAARDFRGTNLFLSFSLDGIHWTPRQRLTSGTAESYYPSLIGTGSNPLALGHDFNVVYTYSPLGGAARWTDGVLDRLTIDLAVKRCPV